MGIYPKYLKNLWSLFSVNEMQTIFQKYGPKGMVFNFNVDQEMSAVTQVLARPGYDLIQNLKIPGTNKTISEQLDALPQNNQTPELQQKIAALKELSLTPKEEDEHYQALETFHQDMKNLKQFAKEAPAGAFKPEAALAMLYPQREMALNHLSQQQAVEKNTLLTSKFLTDLQVLLNLNDTQMKAIQTEAVSKLNTRHADEKKLLESGMNQEISAEHRKEFHRLTYLGTAIDKFNFNPKLGPFSVVRDASKMAESIEKIAKNKEATDLTQMGIDLENGVVDLKNIKLEDLPALMTMTGLPITLEKQTNKKKDGSLEESYALSLKLRGSIVGFARNTSYDLKSLAQVALAQGIVPVEINVTSGEVKTDSRTGKVIGGRGFDDAQKAYAEFIRAGYDPKDIKIKINGQPEDTKEKTSSLNIDELFQNNPDMLENAKKEGKKAREDEKGLLQSSISAADKVSFTKAYENWRKKPENNKKIFMGPIKILSGLSSYNAQKSDSVNVVAFDREYEAWGIFSNYARTPITMDLGQSLGQHTFPTVEHYFQFQKDPANEDYLKEILSDEDPQHARNLGKNKGWPNGNFAFADKAMERAIQAKLQQHPKMKDALLSTGSACLIEDTGSRKDPKNQDGNWGWKAGGEVDFGGTGNKLGILLMKERNKLHEQNNDENKVIADPKELSERARGIMWKNHRKTNLIALSKTLPDANIQPLNQNINNNNINI